MQDQGVRMELRFVREVLEGTFSPDMADEIIAEALDSHRPLQSAQDVLEFCRGPLAEIIDRRAGAGILHAVLQRIEPVLAHASASSEVRETPHTSAEAIEIEFDDDDNLKATLELPMASPGGSVGVLVGASSLRLGETLIRALGEDRVTPTTVDDETQLRRLIFGAAPMMVVIDAIYAPPSMTRGSIAKTFQALPVTVQPVVWGADSEYGRGLVDALKAAGVGDATFLHRAEGIASLLDLIRARHA